MTTKSYAYELALTLECLKNGCLLSDERMAQLRCAFEAEIELNRQTLQALENCFDPPELKLAPSSS